MSGNETHEHDAGQRGDDHDHAHDSDHAHDDDHAHDEASGIRGFLQRFLHVGGHSHKHGEAAADRSFLAHEEGIRVVWTALALLLLTTLLQVVIVYYSGSVALLADTVHNLGDGLNSVPLLFAFYLARRVANRRYTYGFGRAEDVAGIFIVLSIVFSAGYIFWESFQKFFDPEPLRNLPWVAAAAIIGFLGNEAVALLQIRKGREIGSAALVADGLHARTDGLTSLAVLVAAIGTWLGFPLADPIIGLLIGLAVLFITWDASKTIWYRLMDAIEPEYLDKAEQAVKSASGVSEYRRLRMRWMGSRLHAEVHIGVDPALSTAASHDVAEEVRHDLFHALPLLAEAIVHVEPLATEEFDPHQATAHHEPPPSPLTS